MTPQKILDAISLATPQVSADEGFRSLAYLDTRKVWSWGYGDTKHGVGPGKRCTIEEARAWRDSYLAELGDDLCMHAPWWVNLTAPQMAALLEMAYQLGIRGLLGFKKMLAALQEHRWADARDEALDSDWARQTPARAFRTAHQLLILSASVDFGHDASTRAISGATS